MRHQRGVPQETVDALKTMSTKELVARADRNLEQIGLPEWFLRGLWDGMHDVASSRAARRCPCGAPVDMTGRTYEMKCWRCVLDAKAANQTRRRKRAS